MFKGFATLGGWAAAVAILAAPSLGLAEVEEAAGTWETAAPLPEERTEISVTTDGERLYLLGGFAPDPDERATAPREVYAYDPAEDSSPKA